MQLGVANHSHHRGSDAVEGGGNAIFPSWLIALVFSHSEEGWRLLRAATELWPWGLFT